MWVLLQFISGSIQKNALADFLPVMKLFDLLYPEKEVHICSGISGIPPSMYLYSMSASNVFGVSKIVQHLSSSSVFQFQTLTSPSRLIPLP